MKTWILVSANSESDFGPDVMKYIGTEDGVKECLLAMAEYDRDNDKEGFEYGAEDESNIKLHTNQTGEVVKMTTTACFSDYHVDYAAFEFGKIEEM